MADTIRPKLIKFLQSRGTNPLCAACGKNDWAIPEDEAAIVRIPVLEKGGFSFPGPAIPAAVMICNNCGNIRFHAAAMVDPELAKG